MMVGLLDVHVGVYLHSLTSDRINIILSETVIIYTIKRH